MLGLFYLTGVAGLIASGAVLQQLSLSRYGQAEPPPPPPPADVDLAHLNSPEASPAPQHLPCYMMKNKSLSSPGAARVQNPTLASSHTSSRCVWESLLASLGPIHHRADSTAAAASKHVPGCLQALPPLHCGLGNNSALPLQPYRAHQQGRALDVALSSGACTHSCLVAMDRSPALLLPG